MKRSQKTRCVCLFAAAISLTILGAQDLERSFLTPPEATKPYMYWYWLNNNVSARGITKDLEAMRAAGIGEVFIGHVVSNGLPEGDVPILSPEWWELVGFAVTEGERIGVRVSMFNGPGWSQSGGPWMTPEQSMRYLVSRETRVKGGTEFSGTVPKHEKSLQDVAVIAYPAPAHDGAVVRPQSAAASNGDKALEAIARTEEKPVQMGKEPVSIELTFDKPHSFQSLTLDFGSSRAKVTGKIEAVEGNTAVHLRDFTIYRTNLSDSMGPLVTAPFDLSFAPTSTAKIRISFTRLDVPPTLRGIRLSPAARVDFGVEKQLGRMYPEPVPPVDAFVWPAMPESAAGSAVDPARVVVLSDAMQADGTLTWSAPAGCDWIIERFTMATTGKMCGPTPPQATGLECDKMSKAAVNTHFEGMIGEILRRIPADQRKGFRRITLDSYEVGPQNWTDGMAQIFAERFGYDPTLWLAVVGGRVVGSRAQSDRFLRDWRRLVADLIAENYVGGLKEAANRHGLRTWLENYGHWGFPGESLQYGGASDDIGGEYWLWNSLGDVECRLASSTAHIYGKPVVSAEAFTSNKNFVQVPSNIKTRGDWSMTVGINHFVLHLYTHQPYDASPGIVPWFGTDFNRNSTWFRDYGAGWTDYLRRCCHLLQQGSHVADVAYFFGEDTPRMNGTLEPALPQGYDYDFINAEVLLTRARCRDGRIVLPHGQSYRVLVLPPCDTMTPELLAQIGKFVKQGLTLLGNPPLRSPSLKNYPACDRQVEKLAQELWGVNPPEKCERSVGKGRVFRGHSLEEVFARLELPEDVRCFAPHILWTHRAAAGTDIYFLSNQSEESAADIRPVFRIKGRIPELWRAEDGSRSSPAVYQRHGEGICVPLNLAPAESVFVVFRKPERALLSVTRLTRNGAEIADCTPEAAPQRSDRTEAAASSFTMAAFVQSETVIELPAESPSGVANRGQNFAAMPTHGSQWGDGHSGAGFSVGINGVVVLEHWHNAMPPVLVWKAPEPLTGLNHIAVIYDKGVPSLSVNGRHVKDGVASGQRVHPSPLTPAGFNGEAAGLRTFTHALPPDEIVALSAEKPAASWQAPTEILRTPNGALKLYAPQPGRYVATLSDTTEKEWRVPSVPRTLSLTDGPWRVRFEQREDMQCDVEWSTLADWKDSDNPIIKYYSGTAVYRRDFIWNNETDGVQVLLDLGKVREIASVRLNGEKLGILWNAPFRVDATAALVKGENRLEIRVANRWFNRFVGDAQHPDDTGANAKGRVEKWPDWVVENRDRPQSERVSFTTSRMAGRDTPLQSSGLLGDVLLIPRRVIE